MGIRLDPECLRTFIKLLSKKLEDNANSGDTCGRESVEFARARVFDLVLLDYDMPGMNGVETCQWIRSFSPDTGIVMLTVRSGPDDRVRAFEAGADDYILKPFDLTELVARLRTLVQGIGIGD